MTIPFNKLTEEENEHLVRICSELKHNPQIGDWYYYDNRFVLVRWVGYTGMLRSKVVGWGGPVNSMIGYWERNTVWIPNGDQWKWVPGWDMDCGSVVDEVKQIDGSWKKLNVILNAMKPCEAVVSEHENAIYAHALAWEKFTKED